MGKRKSAVGGEPGHQVEGENTFYYGDNLDVLRRWIPPESVDLIYLDPPFQSGRDYNVLYSEADGSKAHAQQKAFTDTWRWDDAAARAFDEIVRSGEPVGLALESFERFVPKETLAYMSMMAVRLVELHRVLKPTGSIFLHCDPTASHYLKIVLDAIFGHERFLNEVVWNRSTAKNDPRRFGRCHDTLLYYSKGKSFTWNQEYLAFQEYSILKNYTAQDPDGRRFRLSDLTANKPGGDTDYEWHGKRPYKGRHWAFSRQKMDEMLAQGRIVFRRTGMPVYKRYLDEMPGVPVTDVWADIPVLASASPERVGYPTQKPLALMKRIIEAASNRGDVVLDPFCGCGTTVEAAQKLDRRWIGIDITHLALELIRKRLGPDAKFDVKADPKDLAGARELAKLDRTEFQRWALELLGVHGNVKRGADGGTDGLLHFQDGASMKRLIVSVKSGKPKPDDLRALLGVVQRDKAVGGVLVNLVPPTRDMRKDAASAGFYSTTHGKFPVLQIVTVEELLQGKHLNAPPMVVALAPKRLADPQTEFTFAPKFESNVVSMTAGIGAATAKKPKPSAAVEGAAAAASTRKRRP